MILMIINQVHVREHKKDNWGIKDSSSHDKNTYVHFIALAHLVYHQTGNLVIFIFFTKVVRGIINILLHMLIYTDPDIPINSKYPSAIYLILCPHHLLCFIMIRRCEIFYDIKRILF